MSSESPGGAPVTCKLHYMIFFYTQFSKLELRIYDFWFFVTGKCDLASQKRVVASKQTLSSLIQLYDYNAIQCKSNFNLMTYFCVQSEYAQELSKFLYLKNTESPI